LNLSMFLSTENLDFKKLGENYIIRSKSRHISRLLEETPANGRIGILKQQNILNIGCCIWKLHIRAAKFPSLSVFNELAPHKGSQFV